MSVVLFIDPTIKKLSLWQIGVSFYRLSLFAWAATAFYSKSGLAAELKGDLRLGYFTREVEFRGDILDQTAGQASNDEQTIKVQIRSDLEEINDKNDRFLFDFRDLRDNFGKLERQNFRLSLYERRQLRLAAYQRPFESNRFYFTVGRFSLLEANILANDGAELGYRTSRSSRFGLFGGQAAKDLIAPIYVDPETRSVPATQFGAYYNYEVKDGPEDSVYLTNALSQAPTYDLTDSLSHLYYYQQGLWTIDSLHRLASLVHFDISPKASMRRGYLSYFYTNEKIRAGGYFQQTSTEDYLIKQTLQDNLTPSTVRSLDLDLRYRYSQQLAFDLAVSRGSRSLDGKSRTEYAFGLLLPKLLLDTSSTHLQFGLRQNFVSRDRFMRFAFYYWAKIMSIQLSHVITDETYDDGFVNKRTISLVDSGFYILDNIRGSLAYQLESDSKVNASALFFMIGYRFGSSAVSAVRTKPAAFEEI